jgi:hypothetical protein
VPTTYVISPEGNIMMEHRGMAKYNTDSFKEFLMAISVNKPAKWNEDEADSARVR